MYIEDLSGNGTWVDDDKIGQGNKRVLSNNSVIALAEQKHQGTCFIHEFVTWKNFYFGMKCLLVDLVFECVCLSSVYVY